MKQGLSPNNFRNRLRKSAYEGMSLTIKSNFIHLFDIEESSRSMSDEDSEDYGPQLELIKNLVI